MSAPAETSTTKHMADGRGTAESTAPLRIVGDTGYLEYVNAKIYTVRGLCKWVNRNASLLGY